MSHIIQTMRIEDYDEVFALWQSTEGVGLNESDSHASTVIFLERNAGLSFIARDEHQKIIGAVLCGHDGRRGYLHHLAVVKSARRQGIGKKLVAACLDGLEALDIHKCNIFLYTHNTTGQAFWQHLGWTERADLRMMQKPTKK